MLSAQYLYKVTRTVDGEVDDEAVFFDSLVANVKYANN